MPSLGRLRQRPYVCLVFILNDYITSPSQNRLQVYADIRVPEIWRYDGKSLQILVLQNREYIRSDSPTEMLRDRSLAFPSILISEISRFLEQAETMEYLDLVRGFRRWLKSKIQP